MCVCVFFPFILDNKIVGRTSRDHDPMAYGGFIMDAAAELGRNPVSKHQIQPEYGDEQADAGRDG